MKRSIVFACAAVILGAGVAAAAPGDLMSVSGTLQQERNGRVVMRSDDGRVYFADLSRAGSSARRFGEPVVVVGREGQRPEEIQVTRVQPAARRGQAEDLLIDGWRLPSSHAYKAQDDSGVYHEVRPQDIPATIARGKEVYDLTAGAWVNHPTAYAATGGMNPAYTASAADYRNSEGGRNPAYTPAVEPPAASGGVLVIDGWRLPRSHIYQAQDNSGVYREVRPEDIPATIARGKEVYDLTASAWVNHPTAYAATSGMNPAYTASPADYRNSEGGRSTRDRRY